jgi:ribonuclease P protein component
MLAKKKRLNRTEFSRFFVAGKRYNTQYFQLIYHPAAEFHGSVVVGKKVFKVAVRRNRLRRQVYAQLYRWSVQGAKDGVYIIIAKPSAGTLTKANIRASVEAVLLLVPRT